MKRFETCNPIWIERKSAHSQICDDMYTSQYALLLFAMQIQREVIFGMFFFILLFADNNNSTTAP